MGEIVAVSVSDGSVTGLESPRALERVGVDGVDRLVGSAAGPRNGP
ncbi:hypothetical protein [Natrinema salaciae]|nr:hypothetical protein [Natrinema salaciae]